jgi:hypothetical protein
MLGAMKRPLVVLCVLVSACTSSTPPPKDAKAGTESDAAKQADADAAKQAELAAKQEAENAEAEAKKAEEAAKLEAAKADAAKADAAQLEPTGETPVFVMLGGSGSRTSKPVKHAVLAHSWGWGSATAADTAKCEANAESPGELMACGTEAKPKGAAKLLAKLDLAAGKSTFVTPEQIADWKIPAPTGSVWLFGPERACKATVGRPLVGWYSIHESEEDGEDPDLSDDFTILELAWELIGCETADETWAPIGINAAVFEPTTRWVPMKAGERERFDLATWTGVLASEIAKLPEAAKNREDAEPVSTDPEWHTQTFELPGTPIRELYFAAAWRDPESTKTSPDEYECGDAEFGDVFQVRMAADAATMIGHGSRGKLVGALVAGAEVHTMIWTDSLDYAVAKLERTGLGESVELSTGVYYPEDGGEREYTLLPYCGP